MENMSKVFFTLFFVILSTTASSFAQICKGPYLIYPGTNSQMKVIWQLDTNIICQIQWGFDTNYSGGNIAINSYESDSYLYGFVISNLVPGSRYFYRVTESGNYHSGSFRAALPETANNIKFLAYGDTRADYGVYDMSNHDIANAAMVVSFTNDPDYQTFVLQTGDKVYYGRTESYWANQFFNRAQTNALFLQANLPIMTVKGNHDIDFLPGFDEGDLHKKYWPYPYISSNKDYWSFDYGPVHIALIDQYITYTNNSEQLLWLETDLAATDKLWKFIILHEPGWSSGPQINNVNVQNVIQPLCEQYNVTIVFSGHCHNYSRCETNGVTHLTTGGGGAPLAAISPGYPAVMMATSTYHYCKIDIQDCFLDFEALTVSGTIFDSFSVSIPEPCLFIIMSLVVISSLRSVSWLRRH